jgi:3-hydroxymyristoyl/3-hydroxydecanoyl-(acyl carrier protein) dehydratase
MSDHFAAFSFVDRISEFVPGKRAKAQFAVPPGIASFPSCLVAEAVGQLAAWTAMAHIGFRGRPVAALATETRFHRDVRPGQTLDLAVEIDSCDDEAVAYHGSAHADGALLIELIDCLGPMLPVEDFDAPAAMQERLALLCGAGATPGRFHGVVPPRIDAGTLDPGKSATATLHVPAAAPFFADHFPRRPVFPATLLLDAQIGLAMRLAQSAEAFAATGVHPTRMTNVKVRAFMAPGDVLDLATELTPIDERSARIALTARANGRLAATARLDVAAGVSP